MLALPAEARGGGERLFHDGGGVDEDFDFLAGGVGEPAGDLLEPRFDEIVIIAVAGVDGDIARAFIVEARHRIIVRPVIHGQHDNAFDVGPERAGPRAAAFGFFHPNHIAVAALGQPLREAGDGLGRGVRRCHAHGVEASRCHALAQLFFERAVVFGF